MSLKTLGLTAVLGSALMLAACDEMPGKKAAVDTVDDGSDPVIAVVNSAEVRESDLKMIEQIMGQAVMQIPAEMRRSELTRVLIDLTVVAEAARKEGYLDRADVRQALRQAERDALYTAYLTDLTKEVSDADIEAAYAEMTANFTPQEEVSARHILVETQEESKEIKSLLNGGADFAEVAKEKSTGPSGANGGDLGYFEKEMMVEPFANVAFGLEVGSISDPVETQFGWHLIKVEDKRMTEAPSLDEVRDSLMAQLVPQKITKKIEELRSAALIDRKDQPVEKVEENPIAEEAEEPAANE